MQLAVKDGCDVNAPESLWNDITPLMRACERGAEGHANWLLEHGAEINHQGGRGNRGNTALHKACVGGFLAVVKVLLEHKRYELGAEGIYHAKDSINVYVKNEVSSNHISLALTLATIPTPTLTLTPKNKDGLTATDVAAAFVKQCATVISSRPRTLDPEPNVTPINLHLKAPPISEPRSSRGR